MQNCKEVSRIVASDEIEGAGLWKRFSVWFHLLMCRHCRRYARQIASIGALARRTHAQRPTADEADKLHLMKSELLGENRNPPAT
jgi:predicted anti-sigma-YlaC factor YlaD